MIIFQYLYQHNFTRDVKEDPNILVSNFFKPMVLFNDRILPKNNSSGAFRSLQKLTGTKSYQGPSSHLGLKPERI